jgi:hypothetical protein
MVAASLIVTGACHIHETGGSYAAGHLGETGDGGSMAGRLGKTGGGGCMAGCLGETGGGTCSCGHSQVNGAAMLTVVASSHGP